MKTVIYITKNNVWAGEQSFPWDGQNLEEIFGRIRRELKVGEARVILGNDVSFVTSMKVGEEVLNRENILKKAQSWIPVPIDSECFDWKEIELVPGEKWLQIIALERNLLEKLSLAVIKSGVKVEMVAVIGVILAEKTSGREAPVVVRWAGKENLLVVAVNGLADLVSSDINEEDLTVYAKQKWGLAVNPEVISLTEAEADIVGTVFDEKTKGEDKLILNLPILKEITEQKEVKAEGETKEEVVEEKTEEKKKSRLGIYLLALVAVIVGCVAVFYFTGAYKQYLPGAKKTEITPTATVTPTTTPEPTKVDVSGFSVQVLNGSGVTGEAAKIKEVLLGLGFTTVDTGNATATTESHIRAKEIVPASVSDDVVKSIKNYTILSSNALTSEEKYDLIIILGGTE